MITHKRTTSWFLRNILVGTTVIAACIAFTLQSEVGEIQELYRAELQARLNNAKQIEKNLKFVESRLAGGHINNAVEMYSIVQDLRSIIKNSTSLAADQIADIELKIQQSISLDFGRSFFRPRDPND